MNFRNRRVLKHSVFLCVALIINSLFLECSPRIFYPRQDSLVQSVNVLAGEQLFLNQQYKDAIIKFLEALNKSLSQRDKTEVYLYLSASYFEIGELESCRDNLRALFKLSYEKPLYKIRFSSGFLSEFEKILQETSSDQPKADKPQKEVPVSLGGNSQTLDEQGKKSSFPWLLVGGLVIVGIVAAVLIFKKKTPSPKLTVLASALSFAATGGSSAFNISNTGGGTLAWTAEIASGDWFSINPASGTNSGVVTVTCTTNTEISNRTGTIRVTAIGATGSPYDVSINQAAAELTNPVLNVTPTSLSLL